MRIVILSQNENVYLPQSFAKVCRQLGNEVVCIVSSPAMSTHGGALKGFLRHVRLFGVYGSAIMAWRVMLAWIKDRLKRPGPEGPFYSLAAVAGAFDIPFRKIERLKSPEFEAVLTEYAPELLISISCPQIIGKAIQNRFPLGCINVHGAPLPRYRGLMPAFWALRNGEKSTCSTVHDLTEKLDDGEILVQREVPITPQDTWDSLVRRTKAAGADILLEAIEQIRTGTVRRRPNRDEEATYYSFPTRADRQAFLAAGRRFF
ncbi:MAG: hypothetical protein JXQ73_02960 [Phycisphaerae bacterium]|nr:hypothetical protein [Phycisphaerae bacterium]